jgi:acyl phosphate:glycerol-3-phosphate acyltransferase
MRDVISIAAGYLLGSISSTWIIMRLFGKQNIRGEADGTISPAFVFYKLGRPAFMVATLMDVTLATSAVLLAWALTHSTSISMLAGFAAMAGHNWSAYLHFKGGQGATAMGGALLAVMLLPLCYGVVAATITSSLTHRSGLSTAVGVLTVSFVAFIQHGVSLLAIYPLSLFSLMLIKRLQLSRATAHGVAGSGKQD